MSKQFTSAFVFVCLVASNAMAVPVSDGSIFFDDFTGAAGALTTADPRWDQVDGTITLDGTTLATHSDNLSGIVGGRSVLLDFSSAPNEWIATARFQINGTLNTTSTRQYHILSGSTDRSPLGSDLWESIGFDVRAEEVAGNTAGTGSTFNLRWFGWDNINDTRVTSSISGASALNKGEFYTLTLHRKSDDMIDIYLEDTLIDTKSVLVGSAGGSVPGLENPKRLQFGDFSTLIAANVTFDYFSMGSQYVVPPVPEPSSAMIWGIMGLTIFARRSVLRRRIRDSA